MAASRAAILAAGLSTAAILTACTTPLSLDEVRGDLELPHRTRLMWAAESSNLVIMRKALVQGEDPNAVSAESWSPLHFAADAGTPETVRLLVEHGARPDARSDYLLTPLHLAVQRRSLEVTAALADGGAGLDVVDAFGMTPLHYAARDGDGRLVDFLVERGAVVRPVETSAYDLRATACSYRALAAHDQDAGREAEAIAACSSSSEYYERAGEHFDQLAELTERRRRGQEALETARVLLNAASIALAQTSARYQAKSAAKRNAALMKVSGSSGTARGYGYESVVLLGSGRLGIAELVELERHYRSEADTSRKQAALACREAIASAARGGPCRS